MKLRNKKTGEIGWLYCDHIGNPKKMTVFLDDNDLSAEHWDYESLAELNADWEDVKENSPAEPLIKDEKIRKAVRAWAEAEYITKAYLENDYTICRDDAVDVSISFYVPVFKDVGGTSDYTIAELCGEEEE